MTLRNIYIIILFLGPSVIFSQSHFIQGALRSESGQAVSYANILLLRSQDSTAIAGTTSDDDGVFRFNEIGSGQYVLKISFIGFQDQLLPIDLTADVDLPTVQMKEEVEILSQVNLVVTKPTLIREADRLVFNVERTSLSEGNIMDVIRRTPGVLVLDEAITVKNTAPAIYINDRKVNLNTSDVIDLLQGTSASNIKSIEVITNPSARYDADSGTVLNIVMSRNLITGYSGSIFSNYIQGVFPKYNVGTSHLFKSKSFNGFVNYSYNDRKIDRVNREKVYYPAEEWTSDIDRNTRSETHNVNLNLEFNLNANNRINVSSNMLFLPYFKYLTKNKTNITPASDASIGSFRSRNSSRDLKHNLGFNLDYEHIFKKDNAKLIINAHTTLYDYRRNQRVDSDYFLGDNSLFDTNAFKTRSDQDTQIFTSQADYVLPLGESATFETGVKLANVKTESGLVQKNIVGNSEIIDPGNSDSFEYDENVYAGYLNYRRNGEKWNYNFGIRVEQTLVDGRSISLPKGNKQDYLEWFPTASINYSVSDKTNMYINYKRSIRRPDYNNLNPFKFFINDNTIVTGNPELQPIFIDHAWIGVSWNNKHTVEFYYKINDGNIFELPIQDNVNNIISYTPINFSSTTELGFDYSTYFNLNDSWNVSFDTSTYYTKDKGNFNSTIVEIDKWANYSVLTNSFMFLKDKSLVADLSVYYISENVQGFQSVDTRVLTELSVKKTVFKGRGILSLAVNDFFNDHDFMVRTEYLDQKSSIFSNLDNRYVRFGFRYKFGNIKLEASDVDLSKEERDRLKERN